MTINQKSIAAVPISDVDGYHQKNISELVKVRPLNTGMKYRFDFEIGCLVKSPCKECRDDMNLPECADKCTVLDKIQTILAEGVSCTRRS